MVEIILLGTFHYPGRFDIFSQEVQKQIAAFTDQLAQLKPNKIAVEFPYRMQAELDRLYQMVSADSYEKNMVLDSIKRWGRLTAFETQNEIVQLGFRLGQIMRLDRIYGIDEEVELSDELIKKVIPFVDLAGFQNGLQKMEEEATGIAETYFIHNSEAHINFDHGIYLDIEKVNDEGRRLVSQWYERNTGIFSNIQKVCEDGDRMLVLIGSAHLKLLKDMMNANSRMLPILLSPSLIKI